MTNRKKDLFSAIFFLAFSVFIYVQSYAIKMSKADALGPQFFPRLVSYAIAALATIQIARYFSRHKEEEQAPAKLKLNIPLIGTIGILTAYFLFLKQIGFIALTIPYLFCQMFFLFPKGAFRDIKTLIIASVVSITVPIGIYLLFYHVFKIFLPPGILS